MNRYIIPCLAGLFLLLLTHCTEEPLTLLPEDRVVINQVSEDYFATITRDSTDIIRSIKNGSEVQTTIKYQAITYEDIDSIQWVFSGATTETKIQMSTLKPSVDYEGYGLFPAQLILTKYDTVSENKITIRRDTLSTETPVSVIFEEKDWSATDWVEGSTAGTNSMTTANTSSLTTNSWTSFPFSNMVILKEVNVSSTPVPYVRSTQFSGFQDQRLRLTFEYKITRKGGSKRFTGSNKKFDVVVDGFTRMQIAKTPNDTYQNAFISLEEARDFDIQLIKYPGMTLASWELTPTALPTICQEPVTTTPTSTTTSYTGTSTTTTSTTTVNTPTATISSTAVSSSTSTTPSETLTNIQLFHEYDAIDEMFGYIEVTEEKRYYYLNYRQAPGSPPYQFGTDGNETLSLTADCPIELTQGKYKVFVYLDEGFPAAYTAIKLPNSATYSSTIVDPHFFDLFIKNFKIEAY